MRYGALRFTPPLAKHAQRIFASGNSVYNFFRNERQASGNLFPRAGCEARSAEILVGFLRLGGKCFVVLARNECDLAFTGFF